MSTSIPALPNQPSLFLPSVFHNRPADDACRTFVLDMDQLPLGESPLALTRLGLGAWAIGGEWAIGWGPQDDRESIAAIRHAVERGVNWIDTAAVYGLGHSEEVIGRALAAMPRDERPFVFTKCGLLWDDSTTPPRRVANPASVRRELDDSLRRLGVEPIDLYQVHWPSEDGTPVEEYWGALVELRAEGKVRAIGLSNHDVSLVERAHRVGRVDSVQPPFSMIRRDAAAELIPWCAAHDVGVIVYSPMQAGLLSGAFSTQRMKTLAASDWRAGSARFSGEALERGLALAEGLRPIAAKHETTVAAVAVAWTLAWPGVTGAIVGARRPSQVDGWIGAGTLELDDADLDEVAAAIERTGAGSGPVRPALRRTARGSGASPR